MKWSQLNLLCLNHNKVSQPNNLRRKQSDAAIATTTAQQQHQFYLHQQSYQLLLLLFVYLMSHSALKSECAEIVLTRDAGASSILEMLNANSSQLDMEFEEDISGYIANNNTSSSIDTTFVNAATVTATYISGNAKTSQEMVAVTLPGDIILGGLFPVHEKGENTPCGPKVYNRGVHRLEAMLYAIDRVNNDSQLLPGITIGVHILDTCSRDTYALNQSLQFVRASLNNLDTSAFECPDDAVPRLRKNASSGPVFGVIGGSYSSVSLQVANLLRLFHIPQISPASTAKTLSDKTRFDLFARTVPPDTFQSVALVDIIKWLNWSYISTIHSEGSYGEYGIEAFHKEATERNVCIAAAEKVPSAADDKIFDAIIGKLQKKPNARGVVLFTRAEDARRILLAAKRANLSQPFHWIASDGWGKQQKLLGGLEEIAEGAITVELQSELIEDFDRYMMNLTPETNTRNPWFEEYWEDTFNCILPKNLKHPQDLLAGAIVTNGQRGIGTEELQWFDTETEEENAAKQRHKKGVSGDSTRPKPKRVCDSSFRLSEKVGYEQESKTQFVVDAVYAFAHALHKLYIDVCVSQTDNQNDQASNSFGGGISTARRHHHHHSESVWYRQPFATHSLACPDMANYDGKDFYNNYLLNVSFIDLAGSVVKFDRQGDGLARYDILNYQRLDNSSGYHYKVVGKWFNHLELNLPDVVWNKETELPISACSLPCEAGMIKKQQGDTCCWICDNCEPYEYVYDEFTCRDCSPGYWPYADKLSCFALDIQYIRWKSLFAVIPMAIAVIGIIMTVIVIVLFAKNHDTPLVRASGRELSYTLLFGILVCYCNTFALIAKPTIVSCVLQRFGIGVGFSIIYSALLTKTNRISRIFHSASKSAQRLKYISPQSQVVITASLIAIQVLITMIWMIVEPPGTRFYYPDRSEVILKCKIQDMSFLFSQLYNMILITICTVYAIKTRKIPENFNESKFIGFTMYTTCIIWLAFVPIYFGTGNSYEIQITTLCISISLSASVALICLYSPKVYILVFHPDKNVRKLTMNSTVYRRSAPPGALGGGMGNLSAGTVTGAGGAGGGGVSVCGAGSATGVGGTSESIGAQHITVGGIAGNASVTSGGIEFAAIGEGIQENLCGSGNGIVGTVIESTNSVDYSGADVGGDGGGDGGDDGGGGDAQLVNEMAIATTARQQIPQQQTTGTAAIAGTLAQAPASSAAIAESNVQQCLTGKIGNSNVENSNGNNNDSTCTDKFTKDCDNADDGDAVVYKHTIACQTAMNGVECAVVGVTTISHSRSDAAAAENDGRGSGDLNGRTAPLGSGDYAEHAAAPVNLAATTTETSQIE